MSLTMGMTGDCLQDGSKQEDLMLNRDQLPQLVDLNSSINLHALQYDTTIHGLDPGVKIAKLKN